MRAKSVFALLALFIFSSACARSDIAESAELETYHEGSLHIPDNKGAPKKIYVDCQGGAKLAASLDAQLEKALGGGNFRIVGTPSEAGYILHINIIQSGKVAPDVLKGAVKAGYGKKMKFQGSGADAMLVDALMVQRRVPKAERSSQRKLKNISARNALESSQMRVGVLNPGKDRTAEDFTSALARALAYSVSN